MQTQSSIWPCINININVSPSPFTARCARWRYFSQYNTTNYVNSIDSVFCLHVLGTRTHGVHSQSGNSSSQILFAWLWIGGNEQDCRINGIRTERIYCVEHEALEMRSEWMVRPRPTHGRIVNKYIFSCIRFLKLISENHAAIHFGRDSVIAAHSICVLQQILCQQGGQPNRGVSCRTKYDAGPKYELSWVFLFYVRFLLHRILEYVSAKAWT